MSNKYTEEDEINLRELWQVIWNKKLFIVMFTTMITIGSIIWAMTRTPIYEAKTLLKIGSYKPYNNNNIQLDNASQLERELNVLFIDMFENAKDKKSTIKSINIPKGSMKFIEIKAQSISNKLAKEEIEKVIIYIQKEHLKVLNDIKQQRELDIKNIDNKIRKIRNKSIPLLSNKIKLLETNLKNLKNQISEINHNLVKIKSSTPSLAALRIMEKQNLSTHKIDLETKLMDMQNTYDTLLTVEISKLEDEKILILSLMLPHNYTNTKIIGDIMTNDYPIKPKKKLIVVVSFVTGLILAIFLAFFLNFIGKNEDTK